MFEAEKFFAPAFVTVAIPVPIGPPGVLVYRIPEAFRTRVRSGMCVLVPVGRRKITGIVVSCKSTADLHQPEKVKDILDIVDEDLVFPENLIRLWQWASHYYLTSPGEMLSTILPGGLRSESTRIVRLTKTPRVQSLGPETAAWDGSVSPDLSAAERAVLSLVGEKKRVTTKTLRRRFPALPLAKILQRLETLQLLEVYEHLPQPRQKAVTGKNSRLAPYTDTLATSGTAEETPQNEEHAVSLSGPQEEARAQIIAAVHTAHFRVFLLHGVTGSGKTEVYLQAAQVAVDQDRTVLFLVPEIALTKQLLERVQHRFGTRVAVLHSAQVAGERWSEWRRIARGEATIVVGVRSAVFAPLVRLGLIVVDEEHDTAYKQEEGVRYNARDIAVVLGQTYSCPVILGSATPSLESYAQSRARRYTLIELPERVESRRLPAVEIVDLRRYARAGGVDKIFSPALRDALIANQQAGQQSLLFLNRRGYASYLQCQLCGTVLACAQCSVTLTFHLKGGMLRCHYCGFSRHAPEHCPGCGEGVLAGYGIGTEQVEEALYRFLPGVRVARLDRDSIHRRGALDRVLHAWRSHEIDVLIGTQMVTKGHDVPSVTLVGVLLADVSLNLPDFRAAERTFQLLTQVAGRAGRGQEPGRVIIQTYMPQHYSIRFAAQHDFARFALYELRYRKRLRYPPFTRMVNIRFEGKDAEKVQTCAEHVAQRLRTQAEGQDGTPVILGPAPAPLERLKGRARWQVLLKAEDRRALHTLVRKSQAELFWQNQTRGVRIVVDVDPYNML